ncbi:MAG TPA: helix-turn-helix domain-containing protein, partial [Lachnospiraceae bacterium]|nr:helix-turn-helix domain-containing protein [Lachnospiraceae bacterium]
AIVLTGYSEFEYAQRAIQLEVVEYLLKPLNIEDIIEVLNTVSKKLSKNKIETASAEQLLFSVLTGDESEQELVQRQFDEKIRHQPEQPISMFLIRSESILEETTNQMVDVLQDTLNTICLTGYYIFKLPFEKEILVMILDGQNVHYLKEIFKMRVTRELKKTGEYLICYDEISNISMLKEKLRQMQDYFMYTFVCPENCILDTEVIKNLTFKKVDYPEYLENAIRRDIRNGNKEGIRKTAGKFEETVIHSREEPVTIKKYTVRFVVNILDTARDLLENKDIESLYNYLLNDMMHSNIKELFLNNYWKMIDMIAGEKKEDALTENGMILNVIEFIRQNYDKEISLSEAAELVGITPEYLSKLFSKEMGINFSTFLGEFRVSIAKKLLVTGNYKIYEVAEMVGYKDTKYFNKVFRSIMGVSPSDYRKVL